MRNTNCKTSVPVIIISGFLGAGKTTFIQKLVSSRPNRERVVILENEFGDVDLDGALLQEHGLSVVSVQGGCICCTGIGDFTGSIQTAVEELDPELIIIEPTGVAKLSEVLVQFGLPPLSQLCDLKQVITVADAKNFKQRHLISEEFYENQLKSSNVIFLSKTEGMEPDDIGDVARQIEKIAPESLLVAQPWEFLTADQQDTCLGYRKAHSIASRGHAHHDEHCSRGSCEHEHDHNHDCHEHEHHDHAHDHHRHSHDTIDHAFSAYTAYTGRDAEYLQANADKLATGILGNVLRVKGLLTSADGSWDMVDYVPGEFSISTWEGAPPERAYLTFIGTGLLEEEIENILC